MIIINAHLFKYHATLIWQVWLLFFPFSKPFTRLWKHNDQGGSIMLKNDVLNCQLVGLYCIGIMNLKMFTFVLGECNMKAMCKLANHDVFHYKIHKFKVKC